MMKKYYYILFLLFIAGRIMAQSDIQQKKDSLEQVILQTEGRKKLSAYNQLAGLYFPDADSDEKMAHVFSLYDAMREEAERQDDKIYQGLALANKLMLLSNRMMFEQLIEQADQALQIIEQKEIGPKYYYHIYRMKLLAWQRQGKYEQAIAGAKEMYAKAQIDDYKTGMGLALYIQAKVCQDMYKLDEQLELAYACIPLLEDDPANISVINVVWGDICMVLLEQKRYDEALEAVVELEKSTQRMDEFAGVPVLTAWSNVYAIYIKLYEELEDYEKLEYYCNKIESTGTNEIDWLTLYKAWARIYSHRNQYDQAIEMIRKAEELIEDTYSTDMLYLLSVELAVERKREKAVETYRIVQQMDAITDSIHTLEVHRQLDEIRTQYEVDRHIIEKERNRNYALLALIGLGLTLLTLGIWAIYSRRLLEKNRSLVRRLREQDALALRVEQMQAAQPADLGTATPPDPLYSRLATLIDEQIYTDPDLTRATLVARMNTNDRYLSDLIRQHHNQTVSDFITGLRLRHARQLLSDPHSSLTIEAIALDSGFGSRTTFHHLFRKHYGLSPTEFRRLSLQETEGIGDS